MVVGWGAMGAAAAAISLVTICVEAFGIFEINSLLAGSFYAGDGLDAYGLGIFVVNLLAVFVSIGAGVCWVIWQYHAARQVLGATRRSPGWHVGSWFVPIVNFWYPFQNISDLWRAMGRPCPSWQIVWWLLWIFSSVTTQISAHIFNAAEGPYGLRTSMGFSIAGEMMYIGAAALALLLLRGITAGLRQLPGAATHAYRG